MFNDQCSMTNVKCLIGGMLWLLPLLGWGQAEADRCRQRLDEAAEQMRRPRQVLVMLADSTFGACLGALSKSDQLRAYRLRAQAHLLLSPPEDEAALVEWERLLALDPEYQLDTLTSPDVFIALSEQFINRPLLLIGIGGGLHLPRVLVASQHSTANPAVGSNFRAQYRPNLSWQIGAMAWLNLNGVAPNSRSLLRWELGADLRYQVSQHAYEQQWRWLSDQPSVFRSSFEEQQSSLSLGLRLRHNFDRRTYAYQPLPSSVIPYVILGARWHRLQAAALSDIQLLQISPDAAEDQGAVLTQGLADPRIGALRANTAWSATLAAGAKWKVDRHYVFAELTLDQGLTNLVEPGGRYAKPQLLYQYGYLDPDWTYRRLMLSVGFLFTQYRIKRRP